MRLIENHLILEFQKTIPPSLARGDDSKTLAGKTSIDTQRTCGARPVPSQRRSQNNMSGTNQSAGVNCVNGVNNNMLSLSKCEHVLMPISGGTRLDKSQNHAIVVARNKAVMKKNTFFKEVQPQSERVHRLKATGNPVTGNGRRKVKRCSRRRGSRGQPEGLAKQRYKHNGDLRIFYKISGN